jgi:NAD(P)-dependent dehydrogenase (short-subunit alcohol dehydrogenase family)
VALDVTDEIQAQAAVKAAVARFGRIDIPVNNAGYGLVGAVEEATGREIEALYRTNVFGLLAVTRAVLPQMRRQRAGRILNFSSVGGYVSHKGFGVYGSTKFAVEGLTESLAEEVAPLGIQVTAIEPGYFRTDFLDSASLSVSSKRIDDYRGTAGAVRERARDINHAQPGDPNKLADVVIALADVPYLPVRLPLGSDTVAAIEKKNAETAALIETWRVVAISTDFAADPAVYADAIINATAKSALAT